MEAVVARAPTDAGHQQAMPFTQLRSHVLVVKEALSKSHCALRVTIMTCP